MRLYVSNVDVIFLKCEKSKTNELTFLLGSFDTYVTLRFLFLPFSISQMFVITMKLLLILVGNALHFFIKL